MLALDLSYATMQKHSLRHVRIYNISFEIWWYILQKPNRMYCYRCAACSGTTSPVCGFLLSNGRVKCGAAPVLPVRLLHSIPGLHSSNFCFLFHMNGGVWRSRCCRSTVITQTHTHTHSHTHNDSMVSRIGMRCARACGYAHFGCVRHWCGGSLWFVFALQQLMRPTCKLNCHSIYVHRY